MLKPKIKHVKALIPIMCKLALNFKITLANTITLLKNPPRKKKYNSATESCETLNFIKTNNKIACTAIGIFLSLMLASVNELTTPNDLNKKYIDKGNSNVNIVTCTKVTIIWEL